MGNPDKSCYFGVAKDTKTTSSHYHLPIQFLEYMRTPSGVTTFKMKGVLIRQSTLDVFMGMVAAVSCSLPVQMSEAIIFWVCPILKGSLLLSNPVPPLG